MFRTAPATPTACHGDSAGAEHSRCQPTPMGAQCVARPETPSKFCGSVFRNSSGERYGRQRVRGQRAPCPKNWRPYTRSVSEQGTWVPSGELEAMPVDVSLVGEARDVRWRSTPTCPRGRSALFDRGTPAQDPNHACPPRRFLRCSSTGGTPSVRAGITHSAHLE